MLVLSASSTAWTSASPCTRRNPRPTPPHRIDSAIGSTFGVVLGLGPVTSVGCWTRNVTEVQRTFSARNAAAAPRTS